MKRKCKYENFDRDVLVIGGDHYNALGVIRSLGELGIKPYYIMISNEKICPTASSKYIKKVFRFDENDEKGVLEFLTEKFYTKKKAFIIPTGDPIEVFLDSNLNKLKEKYIIPNINSKQGEIIKHMDKMYQKELCEKNNINYAKSFYIELDNYMKYIDILPYKVIIKPDVSAEGSKTDILIEEGKENIMKGLQKFKEKKYKRVMVQEFLNYDMEYGLMGISFGNTVIIPGINSNDYIYPFKRGNTSYSEMFPISDFDFNIDNIIELVKSLNYIGLFEIEIFRVKDKIYFSEMNFRNSANLYAYSGNNINYIYIYLLLCLNLDISHQKATVDKHYYFCVEPLHLKNVKEGVISFGKCLVHIKNSTKLIFNKKDIKPFIIKIFHVICKK